MESSTNLLTSELALQNPKSPPLLRAGVMGAALIGSAVALDLTSQVALWRKGSTEIIAADTNEGLAGEPRWLAIPGLGQPNGGFMAETLREAIPGAVDYARLSDRGISGKRIGRALMNYYADYYPTSGQPQPRQNVLAHSMGLPTYLMGVEWCLKKGVDVPPIDTMIAFSSPLNAKHTFMEKQIKLVARYPYPGGALSKVAVEFYQRLEAGKFKLSELGNAALGALGCSYRACSPALWSSQVRTIADRDSYPVNILKQVITPETTIMHFGDEQDKTVNVPAARLGLEDFAKPFGARLIVVDTPGDGHNTIAGAKTREHLQQLFAEAA